MDDSTESPAQPTAPSVSRRAFLHVSTFASGVAASYLADYVPPLQQIKDLFSSERRARYVLERLLGDPADLRFHHGAAHYAVGGIHSDNAVVGGSAIKVLSHLMPTEASDEASLFELTEPHNWVLVGGPSSNAVTRELFGHSPDLTVTTPPSLRFVYEFEDVRAPMRRYMASGELQEEAIRSAIVDRDTGRRWQPEEGGWLEEDYLLITRTVVPTSEGPRFRTMIGGTHGLGTRGFELFWADDLLSARERAMLEDPAHTVVQVLARVRATHDQQRTTPKELRILEMAAI